MAQQSPQPCSNTRACLLHRQGSAAVADHIIGSIPRLPRTIPEEAHQAPVGVLLSASRASLVATISTRICDMAPAALVYQCLFRRSERGRGWHVAPSVVGEGPRRRGR